MGYNCYFFLSFVPLHIESPYNFGGAGLIFGVKNPLQRVNGHAVLKSGLTKPGKVGDFFALVSMKSPNFCQKVKF